MSDQATGGEFVHRDREAHTRLLGAIAKSCKDTFPCAWRKCHQHPAGFWPVVTFVGLRSCYSLLLADRPGDYSYMPEQMERGARGTGQLVPGTGRCQGCHRGPGPNETKGSPFIRLARPRGIRLPTLCTGWLIQSLALLLTN